MARILLPVGPKRYNDHLHYGFWSRCFQSQGHEVHLYGASAPSRGAGFRYPAYEKGRPMADVAGEVQPDLFVSLGANVRWQGFATVKCPKVAIEGDFHYIKSMRRYAGASLVIARAQREPERATRMSGPSIPVVWVPFSVHVPHLGTPAGKAPPRKHTVFFGGSRSPEHYPVRSAAVDNLRAAGLLSAESVVDGYLPPGRYYRALRRHMFALACTSKWRVEAAKHLEYAAAGCVVLSDGSPGLDTLLPWYRRYEPGQAAALAEQILAKKTRVRENLRRARETQEHVLAYHTDEVRSREVCAMLTDRGLL